MSPFKDRHQSRQSACLIHGLKGLTAGSNEHYDRLLRLTQSPGNSSEPDGFFRHIQTRLTLLELYQDYFPRQWDKSNADTALLNLELHTPRELEFFDLLDEHCFPCEVESMDFQDGYLVYPLVPEWCEEDWEEMDCLVQCYTGLTDNYPWESVLKQHGLQDSDIDTPAPSKAVTIQGLKAACKTVTSPLNTLWRAFEIIEHSTENLWLDSYYFEPEALEWSRESVDQLTETYKKAQGWLQEFNKLNDWLYTQPERIKQLVALWNAAQRDPNGIQLEIPFVTTISSDQFVSGQSMQALRETRRHYEQLAYG